MPGDRTEQATQYRRGKARRDGDVLRSRELTSAAGTLAGVLCLRFLGHRFIDSFRSLFLAALRLGSLGQWEASTLQPTMIGIRHVAIAALIPVGTAAAAVMVTSAITGILQAGGLQISPNSISFRIDRINPASNLKTLFSLRSASRFGKSLLPASILAIMAVQRIAREVRIPAFSLVRIEELSSDVCGLAVSACWLLLAWALIDYVIEWRSRESRLMMSREEMKQEFKETEGSPQTRSRIRGLQRQLRRRKVKAEVAKAAVVLTNPTHYAVALGFDFTAMDAPKVLAKGQNLMAEEIKSEARWAGVPIVENPPLARSLYRFVEVGHAIPADLYAAVAAILAYLYRQRVEAQMRAQRAHQKAPPSRSAAPGPAGIIPPGGSSSSSQRSGKLTDNRSDGDRR